MIVKTRVYHLITSKRLQRLGREAMWITVGQVASVIGSLVGVRVLTELLDPSAYGELALGMTLATMVNQIILGPLGSGVTRFYAPSEEKSDLGSYLSAVRHLVSQATGIIILLMLTASAGLLIAGHVQWATITAAALVFGILDGYNSILNGIQTAARQRSVVALHSGMVPWVRFLVATSLILWLSATSAIVLVGYSIATILVLGSQIVFFRKTISINADVAKTDKIWRKEIWKYSWPMTVFGIFTWMQLTSDRWALELFSTTQELGWYAVLFQLGYYPISLATATLTQFLAPIFYQRAGDASDARRNAGVTNLSWRLTGFVLGLTAVGFLIALLFHTQIFSLVVTDAYAPVSGLLPWMILAGGVFAAGQTISLNLMSQMKTLTLMTAKITTALMGVTLNFVGAYLYGITGVVMATVLFSISYFLWMAIVQKHESVESPL